MVWIMVAMDDGVATIPHADKRCVNIDVLMGHTHTLYHHDTIVMMLTNDIPTREVALYH